MVRDLSLEDVVLLRRFLGAQHIPLGFYSLAGLITFADSYSLRYSLFERVLLLEATSLPGFEDETCYLQPLGDVSEQTAERLAFMASEKGFSFAEISAPFIERNPCFLRYFDAIDYRDHAEYVYRLEDLATLRGKKFATRRQLANRASSSIAWRMEALTPTNAMRCMDVVEAWRRKRRDSQQDDEQHVLSEIQDVAALRFALDHIGPLNLSGFLLLSGETCIGYSIFEHLDDTSVVCRFQRDTRQVNGLSVLMDRETAHEMIRRGYLYSNWDMDCGLQGLRDLKERARPLRLEKAFVLWPKSRPRRR